MHVYYVLERILRLFFFEKIFFFCVFSKKIGSLSLEVNMPEGSLCDLLEIYRPKDPPFAEIIGPKHGGTHHLEKF